MSETNKPLVWIVILHWRGQELTTACLESVKQLTYKNYKTLLVDNGSEKFDSTSLLKRFEWITVLRLDENFGFAGGCNRGMEQALKENPDFIWLLNNDAVVTPESLDLLVAQAQAWPRAGAVGAGVVEDFASGKVSGGYGIIDFRRAKTKVASEQLQQPKECAWLHGSNLLLRAEALKEVGLFDERYFLYFEDTDLCYRLGQSDWKCLFIPQALIAHIGNASTQDKRRYWRAYYYIRNRFLFFDTYLHGGQKLLADSTMLLHVLRHCLTLPFKGEDGRCKLRAELLGARDYFSGSFGKAKCLDWCEPNS